MPVGMLEPELLARNIGLAYVSDEKPGISRRRHGRGFLYLSAHGHPVRDPQVLARIRSLAVPPAWSEVWICAQPRGHIQSTGRDAKGRKQYIYHPRWREKANLTKFTGLVAFANTLPHIRRAVRKHLAQPDLCCDKLLALLVAILDQTGMRVGNEEYAEANDSYGLTTLRKSHLHINGKGVEFRYRGKSGQMQHVVLGHTKLVSLIKCCAQLPGRALFQYLNAGKRCSVTSYDVNDYLRQVASDESISAKDFRTWRGTVLAAAYLNRHCQMDSPRERKRLVTQAVAEVAAQLGNTATVCRSYYIHPFFIDAFLDGQLPRICEPFTPRRRKWLTRDEQLVLHCLASSAGTPEAHLRCA